MGDQDGEAIGEPARSGSKRDQQNGAGDGADAHTASWQPRPADAKPEAAPDQGAVAVASDQRTGEPAARSAAGHAGGLTRDQAVAPGSSGSAGSAHAQGSSAQPDAAPPAPDASISRAPDSDPDDAERSDPDGSGPVRRGAGPLIVGIGASAGGLEAYQQFFAHMPADTDMAFVLVQHLSPDHHSMLPELLGRATPMPVAEAADGERMQSAHVYVIPPDATLTVDDGMLRVTRPAPPRQHRWPVDALFTSLAEEHGERAVCIVLAGSGSDGARGLRAVKEYGGLTLAQAGFDHVAMTGMPASAEATGLVDEVLPVEEMPARLLSHYRNLGESRGRQAADGTRDDVASQLQAICRLLCAKTGHDFSQYKEKTLVRRIQRRMYVAQTDTVAEYVAYLRRDRSEYQCLFHELLISVTRFFRDPAAFQALARHAIPNLLARRNASDTLRVWVPGCATGEEAYSIAIAIKEAMPRDQPQPRVMIFATDIDERAIDFARAGRYRAPLEGVSPERRERWFVEEGDDFCVAKSIRELCVFSTHSVLKDPPFSRLDLVSCRNLLIYLDADAQRRLLGMFHYALRSGGYLLLGTSESVSRHDELFEPLDKKQRLYARRDGVPSGIPTLPSRRPDERAAERTASGSRATAWDAIDRVARRAAEKHAPAYVVVDARCDVLRFNGDTGRHLGPASGAASLNLFTLLHKGLRGAARQAVDEAFATGNAASAEARGTARDGKPAPVGVVVEPLPIARDTGNDGAPLWLVTFIEREAAPVPEADAGGKDDARLQTLEHELETTRTQLQGAVDSADAATEELKSSNEEYQSVNEELQSSNEELETSKEELQSINEELNTVNNELHSKNESLSRLNSDLRNLLESTRIATLFLDEHLHIRSYTPATTDLFHLREGDRGRPITEIAPSIAYPQLRHDVARVLRELGMVERVLQNDADGPEFLLRMRPYRTIENVIDGVVLTFVDITESRKLNREHARLAAIVKASKDAIIGLSLGDRITSWNPAAARLFGLPEADAIGKPLAALLPAGASQQVRGFFASRERERRLGDFEMTWARPDGTSVPLEISWAPVHDDEGKLIAGEIFARDVSERLAAARGAELMMRELDHRVKNTLASVEAIAQLTLQGSASLEAFEDTFMARLLSLSRTHNLLASGSWHGADLGEVVRGELQPYQGDADGRTEVQGRKVMLPSKTALALSMAVHELATNAVKYGAFSRPGGKVAVHWETRATGDGTSLHLRWTESGGPPVATPSQVGFGHRLITNGVAYELDGTVELDFAAGGVVCTMDIPLPLARASD